MTYISISDQTFTSSLKEILIHSHAQLRITADPPSLIISNYTLITLFHLRFKLLQ